MPKLRCAAKRARWQFGQCKKSGWRWQAALTGNTCPVCISMHGSIHPVEEEMESHINCRCCSVPVTKSWEELALRACEEHGPVWVEPTRTQALSWGLTFLVLSPTPMCRALRDVG